MEAIRDKRVFKSLEKEYKIEFCPVHCYCTNDDKAQHYMFSNGRYFTLNYVPGCFNPFLFMVVDCVLAGNKEVIFKIGRNEISKWIESDKATFVVQVDKNGELKALK